MDLTQGTFIDAKSSILPIKKRLVNACPICVGFLDSSVNRVVHLKQSEIGEYQWDSPSPQELLLYRKLSDITYEVEETLNSDETDGSTEQHLIHDASATIRKHLSEYIGHLFDESQRLEYQLSDQNRNRRAIPREDAERLQSSLEIMSKNISVLVNCAYVWNVAEIFWIESFDHNNPIQTTLNFLEVIAKYRGPTERNVQVGTDQYWKSVYQLAIYGKLHRVVDELVTSNELSGHSKKLMQDLCAQCPLVRCLEAGDEDNGYEEDVAVPTKEDILRWREEVKSLMGRLADQKRLVPLLRIFVGDSNAISRYVDDDWLNWISGYLLYAAPWMDHEKEMASLLARKATFKNTSRGSIKWMFGAIMSREFSSILRYVDKAFPRWFAPHLCYLVRRLHGSEVVLKWPREQVIARDYGGDYNAYIAAQPRMTEMEWIFEHYVESLLTVTPNAWLWLKHYIHFFERRGRSMLSAVLQNIPVRSDKMAYLMLQTCDEMECGDAVYNAVCMRMAQQSFADHLQFGRIAYWTSKCRGDGLVGLDQFVGPLLDRFLANPSKYIDTLHDVCDNAPIEETRTTRALRLLSRLRDMYLCRYDLQRADIENTKRQNFQSIKARRKAPKSTPFTTSRGHLIDALSKPMNPQNRNLKKIADSFDIAGDDDDGDFDVADESDRDDVRYPDLSGNRNTRNRQRQKDVVLPLRSEATPERDSTTDYGSSPFPKSIIKAKDKKMEQRMSQQFLLQRLVTPPRPTPSRRRIHSHRTSSHKKSGRRKETRRRASSGSPNSDQANRFGLNSFAESESDSDDAEKPQGMEALEEGDRQYMLECCDIISSYMKQFAEIIEDKLSESSHFIRMLLFSLPVLMHEYAPNSITVNEVLLIAHQWYHIKFMRNARKTGIREFSKKGELHYIQETLAHLQAKVLSKTYSQSNLAEIWKQRTERAEEEEEEEEEDA